jgi:hypothetical protein
VKRQHEEKEEKEEEGFAEEKEETPFFSKLVTRNRVGGFKSTKKLAFKCLHVLNFFRLTSCVCGGFDIVNTLYYSLNSFPALVSFLVF